MRKAFRPGSTLWNRSRSDRHHSGLGMTAGQEPTASDVRRFSSARSAQEAHSSPALGYNPSLTRGCPDPRPESPERLKPTKGGRHGSEAAYGPQRRREPRPDLRPARPPEWHDRPGRLLVAAFRRLDARQGAADRRDPRSPKGRSTTTTGPCSRGWPPGTSEASRRRRRAEPRRRCAGPSRPARAWPGSATPTSTPRSATSAPVQAHGAGRAAPARTDVGGATPRRPRGSASCGPTPGAGLGEVFVALDDELNREVALKQILDHHADDPTSRTRFVLEAEITGGLEHPGIVPVYGLGSYGDGRPYYAMRFIRGDTPQGGHRRLPRRRVAEDRPRQAVAGPAQAAAAVRRRLQRDRLRPQPGRPAPRHQAGQRDRRQARRDPGGRLGPGQGDGQVGGRLASGRADADAVLGQRLGRDAARLGDGHAGAT